MAMAGMGLLVLSIALCGHANAENSLGLTTESEAEFENIVNSLKENVFLDTSMDTDLHRSLQENLRGEQGLAGPPGPGGTHGPAGDAGPTGPMGPQGAVGPTGKNGPLGLQGQGGPTGPKGPAGAQGLMGLSGPRGLDGPSGAKGEQGNAGPPGHPGPEGGQGVAGPIGKTGAVGDRGPPGPVGSTGVPGPPGPVGKQGTPGSRGLCGETGAQGPTGEIGNDGPSGPKGPQGLQGVQGPVGKTGPAGVRGVHGQIGPEGAQGPRGATGPGGLKGEVGPRGVKGDQGPKGPPGASGAQGPQGPIGARGMPGPSGGVGTSGPVGPAGLQGKPGPRGPDGTVGPTGLPGPKGNDGSLKKYTLTGATRFMLNGGENANVHSKIYSGQENDAPVLFFETEKSPASISMYQTEERQKVASINGYYGNIGIGVTKPEAKLQVKGQVLLSHNFNNVISAKENRKVGEENESVEFDLIGTYWGMDKKAVYIGAYTGEKTKGSFAEKVVFGGSTNEPQGKSYVDLITGKIFAAGFVTTSLSENDEQEEAMSDLEAESLIQVSSGEGKTNKQIDLGRSTKYLHRKVREQADTIAKLRQQLLELQGHFKDIEDLTSTLE